MSRPVTLFTGQWADLPLAELLPKVKEMGYDGVELACWGDHFDVQAASMRKVMSKAAGNFSSRMISHALRFPPTL